VESLVEEALLERMHEALLDREIDGLWPALGDAIADLLRDRRDCEVLLLLRAAGKGEAFLLLADEIRGHLERYPRAAVLAYFNKKGFERSPRIDGLLRITGQKPRPVRKHSPFAADGEGASPASFSLMLAA
jgi:hypothetical protein